MKQWGNNKQQPGLMYLGALLLALTYFSLTTGATEALKADALRSSETVLKDTTTMSGFSLLVGTYTEFHNEKVKQSSPFDSDGIYRVRFNANTDDISSFGFTPFELVAQSANPSFGAISRDHRYFYSVNEGSPGKLSGWQIREPLALSLINTALSEGDSPCYIAISPDNQYLAIANYMSGTVAVYRRDISSGKILELITLDQLQGRGPNKQRQEGPHAHWIDWSADGERLYVVDLGSDRVSFYKQEEQWGKRHTALTLKPGAGPRHMVFHPDGQISYVLNELGNTVVAATIKSEGSFETFQEISTLPEGFADRSQAGHISILPDGKRLLVSNRGHNSIVVFAIGSDGKLTKQQTISSGGEWPRFFLISPDQKWLFVANQFSHSINVFRFDESATLINTNAYVSISQPVFLQVLE